MRVAVCKYQSLLFLLALAICVTVQPLVAQQSQSDSKSAFQSAFDNYYRPSLPPGQQMVIIPGNARGDAVKTKAVTVAGKTIISHQPFQASPDWIADTDVILLNVSSKQLVFLEIQVWFPEFGIALPLEVGQRPEATRYDQWGTLHPLDAKSVAISVAPGDSLTIPMNEFLKQISSNLQIGGATPQNVHIINIFEQHVYFADGTRCQEGTTTPNAYSKPDIDHPGKWVSITPQEFGPVSSGR